jgi:hypothetical protein
VDASAVGVSEALSRSVPFGAALDQEVQLRRQVGGIRIADMDGDGNNDVVAVVYISNSFPPYEEFKDQIYYGTGAGIELTPGWLSDDATHTGDVQIGDIDGDGFNDIVTIHGGSVRSDNVRVYFGAAGGPSTSAGYVSSSGPAAWGTAGALGDIDGDGDLDLATSNQGIDPQPFRPNFVYRNNGSSFFSQPSWISADSAVQNGIDIGDFDGDGLMDIGVAKWFNFGSAVYLGEAGGLPSTTPSLERVFDMDDDPDALDGDKGAVFGDLNGDGALEFFVNGDPGNLLVASDGKLVPGGYSPMPPFSGPQETRLFDVDLDGDLDLSETHFSDGRTHIYLNDEGTLSATPDWSYNAPEVGSTHDFGDLNGDGAPDLVIGYAGDTSIRVFFSTLDVSTPGDTDGDGVVDLEDLLTVLGNFGAAVGGGAADGDLDGSGVVDLADLLEVLSNFGVGAGG